MAQSSSYSSQLADLQQQLSTGDSATQKRVSLSEYHVIKFARKDWNFWNFFQIFWTDWRMVKRVHFPCHSKFVQNPGKVLWKRCPFRDKSKRFWNFLPAPVLFYYDEFSSRQRNICEFCARDTQKYQIGI